MAASDGIEVQPPYDDRVKESNRAGNRSAGASRRLFILLTVAVMVLALGVRLAYWSDARGYSIKADEPDYVVPAQTLVREGRYVDTFVSRERPWTRVPLTSLFFASSFLFVSDKAAANAEGDDAALMAPRYDALNLAQIGVSLLTVVLIMLLAARAFPQRAKAVALVAGLIAALYPPLASSPAQRALSEPLSVLLNCAALYALTWWFPQAAARRSLGILVLTGALLGAASLTRSVAIAFLPFAWLFLFVSYRAWARRPEQARGETDDRPAVTPRGYAKLLASAAIITVTCLLVIAPWTFYNYRQYGSFLLLETANATAYWNYHNYRGEDYFARLNALPDPADRLSLIVKEGTANIVEHPDKALRTTVGSFFYFWHLESNSAVLLNPWDMTQREPDVPDLLHSDAAFILVGLFGTAGLAGVGLRKPADTAGRTLLILNSWLLMMVLLGMIVPYDGRYRLPAAPCMIVLASGLIVLAEWPMLLSARRTKAVLRRNPGVAIATCLLSFWVLLGAYTLDIPPLFRSLYEAWRGDLALSSGDISTAFGRYSLAQKAFPGFYWPYRHAADIARNYGMDDQARSLYAASRQRNPDDAYSMLGFQDLAARHPVWSLTLSERKWVDKEEDEWLGNPWNSFQPSAISAVDIGTGRESGYITGFYRAERPSSDFSYRWSRGRSTVRIPLPAQPQGGSYTSVTLRMSAPATGTSEPMPVTISTSGSPPRMIEVAVGWADYKLDIPAGAATAGTMLVLTIESPTRTASQSSSKDTRLLGVGLDSVTLTR